MHRSTRTGPTPRRRAAVAAWRCTGLALICAVATTPALAQDGTEWRTYGGGPDRLFYNPDETSVNRDNADRLRVKWTFPTDAIVTASPSVARLEVPGEGHIPIAFIQSWDNRLYAIRVADGTELWRFEADPHGGATFPNASSAHIEVVDGEERVFVGMNETLYCLRALTGELVWRFDAGTACTPPERCAFDDERNEILSSPIIADGKIFFGMDVNDREGGKGGFYAIDAIDGRLIWYFDVVTGDTCRPEPAEDIRRFDGYHSEEALGLPEGFLARPGCDFERIGVGCGNVWSSAALDLEREALFFATSNCDTDEDPETLRPPPPMPPFDEAVVALTFDGEVFWRWRPREIDNADLAFGGVPNLFSIDVDGTPRDVMGIGNKDGTYYVIDRDGENVRNGVRWDDADPSGLPYWITNVVPGGPAGGIIASAAVDVDQGLVLFQTAPGFDPLDPQRPTVHVLDMTTGDIRWQNDDNPTADASFAPSSVVPGLFFVGSGSTGVLRVYGSADGELLTSIPVPRTFGPVSSAPTIIDGIVMFGSGSGARSANPNSQANMVSRIPQNVTALCVEGTVGCTTCRGDCNGDGAVTINELILAVGFSLNNRFPSTCRAADGDDDNLVGIAELITAVGASLNGCPP